MGSIENWVIGKKGKESDVGFYTESVREKMMQTSEENYELQLSRRKDGYTNKWGREIPAWDKTFTKYYDEHISPDKLSLAAFAVEPICSHLFNKFSGITTNQAEGLNNLFKSISNF